MSTTYRNIVATVVGLALVFALAFTLVRPAQAAALSQSQIDAIINLLVSFGADQATIDNVRAALTGQPTNNTNTGSTNVGSGTCTPMVFTMNHKMGDMGGEVRNIQKFLNTHGFTVATQGPGSPGNETDYFGPATKAAVIRFQEAYASEILAPVGLTRGTGYWGNSTRAKANAMEQARCAQQNQNNNQNNQNNNNQTQAADELTVSAAAQPANSLAPAGAVNVPFTRFTLTAGSNDVTVSGVKVKLQGLADRINFDSVVLLDENGMQVGRTRVLQSDYTATIGDTVTIPAGQSKTFTVAANMADETTVKSGEVASFAVTEIYANKPVNGTLPIVGAQHTINDTLDIATVSLTSGANYPSITSEEIGTTNVYFGSVRVTNNSSNEDVVLKSIRFYQAGSVSPSDLANVKIVVDGNEYPAEVTSDGKYYYAIFGNGITIARGLSKDVDIKGDIVSGVDRTIEFQIYEASDIVAKGATYGYGAPVGNTFPFTDLAASAIRIDGATVNSLSRSNEAPAANIPPAAPNTVLGAFELDLAGEGIDVTRLPVTVTLTGAAGTLNENNLITNVTLVDQNGRVIAGPVDYTTTGAGTGVFEFSGVTFSVGKTVVFVKGQLAADKFADGDTVQIETDAADWEGVRGTNSGTAITLTGTATGNVMTVRTAKATIVTAASPSSNLVAGATNVVLAEGEVDATTSGDDIRLTNVEITSTASTSTVNAALDNVKIYADLNNDGTYETLIGSAQSFPGLSTVESLSYPLNPTLEVKKGEKVKIAVIGDLAPTAPDASTLNIAFTDGSAFGVQTAVTATVNTAGSGVTRTVSSNGTVTVAEGADNPSQSVLLDATASNNAEQPIFEFKVSADNVEDMQVEGITISQTGTSDNHAVLSYVFTDGTNTWTLTNTGTTTLTLDMTGNPLVVPAGEYKTVTVKVKTNDIGTTVANGDQVIITLDEVAARGVQSQNLQTATTTIVSNDHVVYEAYPTITVASENASLTLNPSSKMELAKFTFTNQGDKDITFGTATTSNQFIVEVGATVNGAATSSLSFWMEDENGNTLCSGTTAPVTIGTETFEAATCDFATNDWTVPAGGSEAITVYVDSTAFVNTGDTLYARLRDLDTVVTYDIDSTGNNYDAAVYFLNGDVNGPTYVRP